jgi:hypothetical protein
MRFTRFIVTIVGTLLFTSCGAGGVFNLNPQPSGDIVLTNPVSGAALQTTLANPFIVPAGAFSVGITENNFSGPYNVSVSAWTAAFNVSCYVPHLIDGTDKTNVVKFSADNAAPVTAPTQPSRCNSWITSTGATQTDEETAQFNDGKGHSTTLYYKMTGAIAAPSGPTTATTPASLVLSWTGPKPSATACGAYVLNVTALNAAGTAIQTSAANPITLSTTGGGYMGFSSASSATAATFACPGTTGSPGGTPTLQLTASPGQVLVYFNGLSAAATTTITASSVGLPSVTLPISSAQATTSATQVSLSWSGPSPTGDECGAYVLNVAAANSAGTVVPTTPTNPITLTTTGGGYMGFSTSTSAAGFTCPQSTGTPPVGSPGGTASLQLTSSPAQVLVYFNGFNAAATTTISGSSVGLATSTPLSIANKQSYAVSSIHLSWSGVAPGGIPAPSDCGAFVLNVTALNSSGTPITSSQYGNPITLSENNSNAVGFSTVFAGISPAPSAGQFYCGTVGVESGGVIIVAPVAPSLGYPTLAVPDTATPSVVYYDGAFSSAPTTITATAAGVSGAQGGFICLDGTVTKCTPPTEDANSRFRKIH